MIYDIYYIYIYDIYGYNNHTMGMCKTFLLHFR